MFLKVVAVLIIAIGALIVFGAKTIVEKYELDKKIEIGYEDEMSEEEISNYKTQRAIVKIKTIGFIITLPGLILVLLIFK